MHLSHMSTSLPLLAPGEPGCCDLAGITAGARRALLSVARGSLRRAGHGWYGPDKSEPIHRVTVSALVKRGLIYFSDPNLARITKRGKWCARTLCSEIAGEPHTIEINGISHFIMGRDDA
jgi:hypothetical protein